MLIPSEVLQNIFSFLPYTETYRLRSVCNAWKVQCEYHMYLQLKSRRQKLFIKIGEKGNTSLVDMVPVSYDYENRVIEFKAGSDDVENQEGQDVYIDPTSNSRGRMQILYSEWKDRPFDTRGAIRALDLADRALALFHSRYNPPLEQIYRIPPPSVRKQDSNRLRYVGDKGMVMCFSYIYPTQPDNTTRPNNDVQFHGADDPAFLEPVDTSNFIRLRVHYIHVTFSWILAGMNIGVTPQPIYLNRYEELEEELEVYGVKDYSPYSEPVLEYVMRKELEHKATKEVQNPKSIIVLPIGNDKSNLELLQSKLQSLSIDPRIIWKYAVAKNFILNGQGVQADDVVKMIQKSEEEWALKKSAVLSHLEKE